MSAPSEASAIELSVNGEVKRVPAGITIAALLSTLDVPARGTAVELNLELVPRARHAETTLSSGDRLEIVTLVGGG